MVSYTAAPVITSLKNKHKSWSWKDISEKFWNVFVGFGYIRAVEWLVADDQNDLFEIRRLIKPPDFSVILDPWSRTTLRITNEQLFILNICRLKSKKLQGILQKIKKCTRCTVSQTYIFVKCDKFVSCSFEAHAIFPGDDLLQYLTFCEMLNQSFVVWSNFCITIFLWYF